MKEQGRKVCLSVKGISKSIVVDKCYAVSRGYFCPAVDSSLLDGLDSKIIQETPDFISVNFTVKNAKGLINKKQLSKAYFRILNHVCDNCSCNAKNNIDASVAEKRFQQICNNLFDDQKVK